MPMEAETLSMISWGFHIVVALNLVVIIIPQTMLSEENSLALGISGILWAISMLCMLIGIWSLSEKSNQ